MSQSKGLVSHIRKHTAVKSKGRNEPFDEDIKINGTVLKSELDSSDNPALLKSEEVTKIDQRGLWEFPTQIKNSSEEGTKSDHVGPVPLKCSAPSLNHNNQ